MFKKIQNCFMIVLFFAVLLVPLMFTRWESGGVSVEENRNLAKFPPLVTDGRFNLSFTKEFETWFMDHLGFREQMISTNKTILKKVFDRSLTTSSYKTGKTGDSIYASDAIIKDFAHVNLRSEKEVEKIGQSYQKISDWLGEKGIPFYYVQCVDKQTVYPERFIESVMQVGNVSKTDQVMTYLQDKTTVNAIYLKQVLQDNRDKYDVFSHWGDPTHWTDRGAYIGYRYMMEQINPDMQTALKVLTQDDYNITYKSAKGPDNQTEQIEVFTIENPAAQKTDVSVLGQWASDQRHSVWQNPQAGNDMRLLLVCDSYFNGYLIEDIAESFGEVWLVWGDYTKQIPEIVELCDPDLVIYECAERVDRSADVCSLAKKLRESAS